MSEGEIQLLSEADVQSFIRANESADVHEIILKHKTLFNLPSSLIANQILALRKASEKIPFFHQTAGIVYPLALNLEQSSSEKAARWKVEFLKNELGEKSFRIADLTAGFGVDSFFLSSLSESFDLVEKDDQLLNLVKHNFKKLGKNNVCFHHASAESFLEATSENYNLIYLDPSRRDTNSKKTFRLQDCSPDISEIQNELFDRTENVLIKTSPLLDITQALKEISFVKKIFIVSVDNDCKEVLFLCAKGFNATPRVETANLLKNSSQLFSFEWGDEGMSQSSFSSPLSFLYEPNASVLKSGCFKLVGEKFGLKKLSVNTHLYTSAELVMRFPGRVFKIETEKPDFKKDLIGMKANVISRNYPLSSDELRKKLNLRDGGEKFVIAFSGTKQKHVVLATRVA